MTFVLGIDGGGTSCRAALATLSGDIVGRGKSGAANIRTDLTGARENIADAARQAFLDAGQDPALIPEDLMPFSASPAAMSAPTPSNSKRSCPSPEAASRPTR